MTYENASVHPLRVISIPAPSSVLVMAMVRAVAAVATWDQRRTTRKHLRDLPDHLYRDIGLTRDSADLEASKFFWRS
ncbi:DUF1127 domain-containing protein [Marivivens donghaensis]|uniref:DUF1127 domain-containing protein n=1 Tax=Marivivens donghaensis TaxID=1699413 RepID=A0ABX0VYK7_9RHOB|nr:DUF1127 domain-containing protein [Marivivens donghaensis]NIY72904.1 DUF1127 domain-containing protein [Marivivens donghaensis]